MKFETKINKASGEQNKSTRTVIPKQVMDLLGLEWGDKIVWNVEILGKNEVNVSIIPKQ